MRTLFTSLMLIVCTLTAMLLTSCDHANHESGYVQVEQGKVYYQIFGTGTPIIVLHGGPGLDQTYLLPQMLELAQHHKVIFYDQRGSGKSLETSMDAAYINVAQFTQDLESLRKQLGINQFILLGHSWGGFLAMNYAITYPDHLTALILVSSGPANFKGQQAFDNEFTQRSQPIKNAISPMFNQEEFEKLTATEIATLYRTLFSVYFYHPNDVNELTLTLSAASAKSGAKVAEVLSQTSWPKPSNNLFPQLKKLTVPTLIVHGKQDIIPLWTAQAIQTAIPKAQILILDECGHFPYIEKPRDMFLQINRFLANVEKMPS